MQHAIERFENGKYLVDYMYFNVYIVIQYVKNYCFLQENSAVCIMIGCNNQVNDWIDFDWP